MTTARRHLSHGSNILVAAHVMCTLLRLPAKESMYPCIEYLGLQGFCICNIYIYILIEIVLYTHILHT